MLFPLEEIVPLGGMDGRELLQAMKSRYEFFRSPDPATTTREDAAKHGYKFESGRILFDGQMQSIVEVSIYTEGIVAVCSRTE